MSSKLLPAILFLSTVSIGTAQQTFTLPTVNFQTSAMVEPFGSIPLRWQVWFAASEIAQSVSGPVRIVGMEFMTAAGGQPGNNIEMELRIANSRTTFPTGSFQGNLVSGEVLAFPATPNSPRSFQLPPSLPNVYAVQIPFANEFIYDGRSGICVEIKIFDNGTGQPNQPYRYELANETLGTNRIVTLWNANGGPNASSSDRFLSRGPRVRFLYRQGVTVPFGDACPGSGFNYPVSRTTGGNPEPANLTWTHVLTDAPSQKQAIWMFGNSNTVWNGLALPYTLSILGAANCELLVNPQLTASMVTVGGGPGAGTASLTTPTPPVTSIVGLTFHTQWLILDPQSINGVLTVSNGLTHVFGPVGG